MAVLEPELCILDESDLGPDIDALKVVADGVNSLRDGKRSFIIVTHYQRILDYIKPDYVHVLYQGRIVKSGDFTLVKQLEEQGYGWLTESSSNALQQWHHLFEAEGTKTLTASTAAFYNNCCVPDCRHVNMKTGNIRRWKG